MHRLLIRSAWTLPFIPNVLRSLMDRPPLASFYYSAIKANLRTANAVASTPYLQSMHNGTLSPLDFGCLTVQDAYYCYRAQETLEQLLARIDAEDQPELHDLVEAKLQGYNSYNRTFLDDWHLQDSTCVLPTETMRRYSDHELQVALDEDPIYALVAYLPCYYLWPWFARQLMMSPWYNPGVYQSWFEGVYEGESESFGGAWLLGNFIETWKSDGKPFDEDLAHDIYRKSMDFELQVFSEACSDR